MELSLFTGSSAPVQRISSRVIVLRIKKIKTKGNDRDGTEKEMCVCHQDLPVSLHSSLQLSGSTHEGGNVRKRRTFEFGLNKNQRETSSRKQMLMKGWKVWTSTDRRVGAAFLQDEGRWHWTDSNAACEHESDLVIFWLFHGNVCTRCSRRLHSSSPQPSATPASS